MTISPSFTNESCSAAEPEIDVATLYRGVIPFVGLQIVGLALIFMWPEIVTWLPSRAYGS